MSSSVTPCLALLRMPSRRSTRSVDFCNNHTSGALTRATICIGGASAMAIDSGCPRAQRLGTSSPMIRDR